MLILTLERASYRTQIGKVESSTLIEQLGAETNTDDGYEYDRIHQEYG